MLAQIRKLPMHKIIKNRQNNDEGRDIKNWLIII